MNRAERKAAYAKRVVTIRDEFKNYLKAGLITHCRANSGKFTGNVLGELAKSYPVPGGSEKQLYMDAMHAFLQIPPSEFLAEVAEEYKRGCTITPVAG